jgi:riboflavin kinase / FMN adenylyltransferase
MSRVFRSLEEAAGQFGPCAVTIGNFDGVHLGHRTLIRQTQQIARAHGWITGVLTFHPHPTTVVAPERAPQLICSLEERIRLLEGAGAEHILVLPFTRQIAEMTPREFVTTVLDEALNTRAVVVGQNFRFGYKQLGDTAALAQFGAEFAFEPHFLAPITSRGELISSTAVRRHLQKGKVSKAGRLLGRCFSLSGEIVAGRGIGSKRTVPTLNIRPGSEIVPAQGIYITETQDLADGRRWHSVTSVGTNPTFGGTELTIETYLLSPFDGRDPKRIRIGFRRWLREERTFLTAEALREEILRDVARAERYWRAVERAARTVR